MSAGGDTTVYLIQTDMSNASRSRDHRYCFTISYILLKIARFSLANELSQRRCSKVVNAID
jgi:hypothetical protein